MGESEGNITEAEGLEVNEQPEEVDDGLDDFDPFAEDDDDDFWLDGEEDDGQGEDEPEPEGQPDGGQPEQEWQPGQPQTPEMNRLLAAARRQAEMESAVKAQRRIDERIRQLYGGQTNPYTGRVIDSEAELNAYQTAYQAEQMQSAGISPQMLQGMIDNNPTVQRAKAIEQQMQLALEQHALNEGIKAISTLDPSIQSLEDITKLDTFPQFDAMVRRGYSLTDAFKLANYDRLTQKRAGAARQRAINQTAGKAHLQPTQGKESGQAVSVPPDVRAMYREMNPGISDKEIAKHYARSMKE